MTAQQKKLRRRRRLKKNVKRTLYVILTAPIRMPKFSRSQLRNLTRACEICGMPQRNGRLREGR